jgi:tRNA(fMet)-specific endonuclease VapC
MGYLLDSSTCVARLRDSSALVARRFREAITRHGTVCISSLVLCELWYGVHKSSRPVENAETLQKFSKAGPLEVLRFEEEDARLAGEIRAELERSGRAIGSSGTLIAAQCVRRDLIVVTSNVSEFEQVKGWRCKDWAK